MWSKNIDFILFNLYLDHLSKLSFYCWYYIEWSIIDQSMCEKLPKSLVNSNVFIRNYLCDWLRERLLERWYKCFMFTMFTCLYDLYRKCFELFLLCKEFLLLFIILSIFMSNYYRKNFMERLGKFNMHWIMWSNFILN